LTVVERERSCHTTGLAEWEVITLTEDELIESLHEIRDGWIRIQAGEVVRSLLAPGEDMAASSLLAPWVVDDELTLATTLTRIASDDALACDPRISADSLRTAGLVPADVPATDVAQRVVSPVVRRVRHGGVRWWRWWDVHGLHCLLVELWAARRRTVAPPSLVRRELRTIWQVPEDDMSMMLANAVQPFSLLPPDIFETSLTGEATKMLRGLVVAGRLQLDAER
jgi:hypothetical protein